MYCTLDGFFRGTQFYLGSHDKQWALWTMDDFGSLVEVLPFTYIDVESDAG